jgi:hypothetical protein
LLRQKSEQLVLGNKSVLDEHAPELAAALFLVRQRGVELLLRNDFIRHQQVADANLLGFHFSYRCHRDFPSTISCSANEAA